MKNLYINLLILLLLFVSNKALSQSQCPYPGGAGYWIEMYGTVSGPGFCNGASCPPATQSLAITKARASSDKSASEICKVRNTCSTVEECRAIILIPPVVNFEQCYVLPGDSNTCAVKVLTKYDCACGPKASQVSITPSSNPNNFCANSSLTLTADINFSNVEYYAWFLNDSVINGASGPVFNVISPGVYELLVVDTDGNILLSNPLVVQCSIPSLTQWGIIIFGMMIITIGLVFILRRKKTLIA